MGKTGNILLAAVAVFGAAAWGASSFFKPDPVKQPLAFSHKRHMQEDIACVDCHNGAEKTPYARFPAVKACLLCHEEPQGKNPAEAKVREFAEKKMEIPWIQVNRLVGHVYFSHAAHVTLAKMKCDACHGDMKNVDDPVSMSQVDGLDMSACISCHKENNVRQECLTCHK